MVCVTTSATVKMTSTGNMRRIASSMTSGATYGSAAAVAVDVGVLAVLLRTYMMRTPTTAGPADWPVILNQRT
jgi:hypothetical protein